MSLDEIARDALKKQREREKQGKLRETERKESLRQRVLNALGDIADENKVSMLVTRDLKIRIKTGQSAEANLKFTSNSDPSVRLTFWLTYEKEMWRLFASSTVITVKEFRKIQENKIGSTLLLLLGKFLEKIEKEFS